MFDEIKGLLGMSCDALKFPVGVRRVMCRRMGGGKAIWPKKDNGMKACSAG